MASEQPDLERILEAYAKVANRVSEAVVAEEQPSMMDVTLLHALSTAALVIGSEFNRHVVASKMAEAGRSRIVQ